MSDAATIPGVAVLRQMRGSSHRDRPVNLAFHASRLIGTVTRGLTERRRRRDAMAFGWRVNWLKRKVARLSDAEILRSATEWSARASLDAPTSEPVARVLALVSTMAERRLGLRAFVTQHAGVAILLQGGIAEMETGSGKTLTSVLAATVAVLCGERVHLVTANDYLAARDCAWAEPLCTAFGFTLGLITRDVAPEDRQTAYLAHIVYGSNKEIAFDYLRNRIALGGDAGPARLTLEALYQPLPRCQQVTMRGLPFAIVDEADSVLVDECRTPLIISEIQRPDPDWAMAGQNLAGKLQERRDFSVDMENRKISLTAAGRTRLSEAGQEMGGVWHNETRRNHAAIQALSANLLFHRDEHYVVREGKIELIDEYTGRSAADRSLGEGVHQMIEAKEGVEITGKRQTKGRITYQRFFRRYRRLAGMTGTAREIAGELASVYQTEVTRIRPAKRSRRRFRMPRLYKTEDAKWAGVVRAIAASRRKGRPVLVATRTIKASQHLSKLLDEARIEHAVLNATQDADEGEIIAQAGGSGRVTVATNMAGRGVDIKIDAEVRKRGGLLVLLTEFHEAGRIDRQVFGRCARQGDPGAVQLHLSWQDPLIRHFGGLRGRWRRGHLATFIKAQRRAERLHARARIDLLKQDQERETQLSFTGAIE